MKIRITGRRKLPKAQVGGECPQGYAKDINGNCMPVLNINSQQSSNLWGNFNQASVPKTPVQQQQQATALPRIDMSGFMPKRILSEADIPAEERPAAEVEVKQPETFTQQMAKTGLGPNPFNNDAVGKQVQQAYDSNPALARNYDAGIGNAMYGNLKPFQSRKELKNYTKWFNEKYGTDHKVPFMSADRVKAVSDIAGIMNPLAVAANVLDQNRQNKELERAYRESLVSQGPVDYSRNRGDYEVNTGMVDPYNTGAKSKGQFTSFFYTPQFETGGPISLGPISFSDDPVRRNVYEYDLGYVPEAPVAASASPATTRSTSEPVESNVNFSLSSDFKEYARKANAYIRKVNPDTNISGEMLAAGAQRAMQQYGRTVPVELALAQLQLEGYLEKRKTPNKPQRTNNPFNVGNTDSGATITHSDDPRTGTSALQSGVNAYYDLMARSYLKKRTPNELLNNFVNYAGNRYASAPHYEAGLKKIINNIQKTPFEEGGMYENPDNMRIRITKEPMENMAYGGQLGYGFDLGGRRVYTDMPESKTESVSNTMGPVPREMATIEAEKGETILNQDGHFLIGGESHANGGTPLAAEGGDFIFSKKLKMKDPEEQSYFNKSFKKSGYGYADVAKQYNMNKYKAILQDPNSDPIAKRTAELMLGNFEKKLGMLAMLQEKSKGFPQGMPAVAKRALGQVEYGGFIPEMAYGGYLEEYQTKGEVTPRPIKTKEEFDKLIASGKYKQVPGTNNWEYYNKVVKPGTQDQTVVHKGTPGKKYVGRITPAWLKKYDTPEKRAAYNKAKREEIAKNSLYAGTPDRTEVIKGRPEEVIEERDLITYSYEPGTMIPPGTGGGKPGTPGDIPGVPKFDPSEPNIPYGWTQPDKNNLMLALMNKARIRKYGSVRKDVNPVTGDFRNMDWRGRAAELQGTYNSQMNQLGTYQSPTSLAANASFMQGQQAENLMNRAIDPIENANVQGYNVVGDRNMAAINQALAGAAQNAFMRSFDRANLNQTFDNSMAGADKGIVQTINQGDVNAAGIYNTNQVESDTHYIDPRSLRMKFNSPAARAQYIAAMRNAGPNDNDMAAQYMATYKKLEGLSPEERKAAMEIIYGTKGGRTSTTTYPFNPAMNRSTVQQPFPPGFVFNPNMNQAGMF
jgi:hypothetical protein